MKNMLLAISTIAIIVVAILGAMLVLDLGSAAELKDTFIKVIEILAIVAIASLVISFITGSKN